VIENNNKYFCQLLLLLIVTIFSGCDNSRNDNQIRERPQSVPKNAIWVGGDDGGVYLIIEKNKKDKLNIYRAIIYHSIGEVDYKGKLSINSKKNPFFDINNKELYSGWDGDTLYLQDGRELEIIQK